MEKGEKGKGEGGCSGVQGVLFFPLHPYPFTVFSVLRYQPQPDKQPHPVAQQHQQDYLASS